MMKKRSPFYIWLRGASGRFRYFGATVFFPPHSILFRRACDEGVYEGTLVQLILASIREDSFYFDVGANIGLLAIPVLSQKPTAQVVSFEPSPHTLPYLERTHQQSGLDPRWKIVKCALSDRTGTTSFSVTTPSQSAYDGILPTHRVQESSHSVQVPLSTLDEQWNLLGQPKVSTVKIDVEGAEMQVLRGAQNMIGSQRPAIFIEWNLINQQAFGVQWYELFHWTQSHGYNLFSLNHRTLIQSERQFEIECHMDENFFCLPQ